MTGSNRTRASSSEGTCQTPATSVADVNFVSLPANIEYADLTNMLAQHLSEHPQVKSIKVVRDSKGGTCAFIQCQVCPFSRQPIRFFNRARLRILK